MWRKLLTSRKTAIQAPEPRIDPKLARITICPINGAYVVSGELGGHKYTTHSKTMKQATDYAHEWLYLYLNGEMY